MSIFMRNLTVAIGSVLVAASKAQAQAQQQSEAMNAEAREEAKWEKRKEEAMAGIENALKNDPMFLVMNGMSKRQRDAIELRARINKACREQDDWRMRMCEDEVVRMQTSMF